MSEGRCQPAWPGANYRGSAQRRPNFTGTNYAVIHLQWHKKPLAQLRWQAVHLCCHRSVPPAPLQHPALPSAVQHPSATHPLLRERERAEELFEADPTESGARPLARTRFSLVCSRSRQRRSSPHHHPLPGPRAGYRRGERLHLLLHPQCRCLRGASSSSPGHGDCRGAGSLTGHASVDRVI